MSNADDYILNPRRELCSRCNLVARGSAHIGQGRYCHPDDPDAPDCYTLQNWDNSRVSSAATMQLDRLLADPDAYWADAWASAYEQAREERRTGRTPKTKLGRTS